MKDWKSYCETTFNSLRSNIHNWGKFKPQYSRPITRIYYYGVFDCGIPNPTGLISESAYQNKLNGEKTVHDHCLSPQFIGRMILDNPEKYLTDYEVFEKLFWKSCSTIVVTAEENIQLSALTENDGDEYTVKVPTNLKYKHLGINLYKRPEGAVRWKNAVPIETNIIETPEELLEYEKLFLTS